MIERACYECGQVATLAGDTFAWDCPCGYSGQRTGVREAAVVARHAGDRILDRVAHELLDGSARLADEPNRVAVAATGERLARLAGSLAIARAPRAAAACKADVVAMTAGLDGERAWDLLASRGLVPDDGARKFVNEHGIVSWPQEVETAIAFACAMPAARAAEDRFRDFVRLAGLIDEVVWHDGVFGSGSIGTVAWAREALRWSRRLEDGSDAERIAVAAEIDPRADVFAALRELYAAGIELEGDAEGYIVLRLPEP